jgi:hypothetical protein
MALRRKRPALKSDAMKKFLEEFFAKATDPVPDSEVKKAAKKRGLNLNMLDEISRGYVNKKRGPGGIYYWSKRTASAYLSDTAAAARKNSVAFRAGYEEAITSMLWSVNSIYSATSDKKSKELCSRLYAALELLREKRDSM